MSLASALSAAVGVSKDAGGPDVRRTNSSEAFLRLPCAMQWDDEGEAVDGAQGAAARVAGHGHACSSGSVDAAAGAAGAAAGAESAAAATAATAVVAVRQGAAMKAVVVSEKAGRSEARSAALQVLPKGQMRLTSPGHSKSSTLRQEADGLQQGTRSVQESQRQQGQDQGRDQQASQQLANDQQGLSQQHSQRHPDRQWAYQQQGQQGAGGQVPAGQRLTSSQEDPALAAAEEKLGQMQLEALRQVLRWEDHRAGQPGACSAREASRARALLGVQVRWNFVL